MVAVPAMLGAAAPDFLARLGQVPSCGLGGRPWQLRTRVPVRSVRAGTAWSCAPRVWTAVGGSGHSKPSGGLFGKAVRARAAS